MNINKKKKKLNVRQLVIVAMLSGISIFLGVTGIGLIPLVVFNLTIMHIPVIIGSIVEGPLVGSLVGLIFGLFSMYQNITRPTAATSVLFHNPVIALVPRILIGVVAYYVYTLLKNKLKNDGLAIGIAAISASLINTAGVLGFSYLFYFSEMPELLNVLYLAIATNGIPEAILSAIVVIPIVKQMKKIRI